MVRRVTVWIVAAVVAAAVLLAGYTTLRSWRIEAAYPPVGRFVEVDGVRLHYLDLAASVPTSDDTPAILFIHGASGNLRDPLLAFRSSLEGRHRLIFVDRPGHGWSTRGTAAAVAAPMAQARLVAGLLARIGVGRVVVVGHSWGAAVATALALEAPERTAGLVLVAPATHPWPGGVDWYYRLATTPVAGPLFAWTVALPASERLLASGLAGVFAPDAVVPGYVEAAAIPLVMRPAEFLANAADVAGLAANLRVQSQRYGEIRVPTVILSGNRDAVVYEELHSGGLARDIPGARLVWLDGVGHMPHHSATERVVTAIEEVANLARGRALAAR